MLAESWQTLGKHLSSYRNPPRKLRSRLLQRSAMLGARVFTVKGTEARLRGEPHTVGAILVLIRAGVSVVRLEVTRRAKFDD